MQEKQEFAALLTEQIKRRNAKNPGQSVNPYIPHTPSAKQAQALALPNKEVLYGGAAGGGKSDYLLMEALSAVHIPNYSAIIFRKTFQDLSLPDGLIPRSHEWLAGTDAKWNSQQHEWMFPTGAKLAFGYLDNPMDKYRYQGAAFQKILFDELTQHRQEDYLFMFSRMRALAGMDIPLMMRSTSNPGGVGHRWVKNRFIDPVLKHPDAIYLPSKLSDNPHLRADYADSLSYLDPVTKARYLDGDWTVIDDDIFVFNEFDRSKHARTKPPSDKPDYYVRIVAGADPGTRDPYAVPILGLTPYGTWWVLDEFYRTGGTTSRWQGEFQALHEKWRTKRWWTDKRKPSDIMDLMNAGLPAQANIDVHGENERDTIRPMLAVVQNLMHEGNLHVNPSCVHTIEEFENYVYKNPEDKNAGEVPVDCDNHAMDAIRYAICSEIVMAGQASQRKRSGTDGLPRPPVERRPFTRLSYAEEIAAQDRKLDLEMEMARQQRGARYVRR